MYNQMNSVFNHSDKLEALGTQYYEMLFKTGVIANRMTENHAQGLMAGEKGAGGYLVPDSMEAQIVQTLAEENVMRRLAAVIHMEDGERAVPVVRSMSDAQWLDENEAMEMGAAGFEAARLKPRKLGLTIPVSNELLADAGVDMAAFLADGFARRIASSEEKAFLTGDGAKQPAGLLNSAQVGVTTATPDAIPPRRCERSRMKTGAISGGKRWAASPTACWDGPFTPPALCPSRRQARNRLFSATCRNTGSPTAGIASSVATARFSPCATRRPSS